MTPRCPVWWYWYRELEGIFKKFTKTPIMLKLFIDFPVFGTKFILQFHFQWTFSYSRKKGSRGKTWLFDMMGPRHLWVVSRGRVGCESEVQAERLELDVWCHHPNWRPGAGRWGHWLSGMKHHLPVALRICRHKLVIPLGPPFPGSLRHVCPLSCTAP